MGKNKTLKLFTNKRMRTLAMMLAVVLVFTTTYALILPAITLDEDHAKEDPAVFLETTEEVKEEPAATELAATIEEPVPEPAQEPAAETPAEEAPAEETPAEETPAAETPAETPAAETPAQEAPEATPAVEGKPVEKKPAENKNANKEKHTVGAFLVEEVLGDLYVTADAEAGVLPEGTRMELRSVTDLRYIDAVSAAVNGEMQNARFVDIHFIDPNGVEVYPAGGVHFSFRNYLLSEKTVGTIVYVDDHELYEENRNPEDMHLYGLIADPADEWNYIDEVTFWSDSVGTYGLVITNKPEEEIVEDVVTEDGEQTFFTTEEPTDEQPAEEVAEEVVDEEALEEKMPAQHFEMVSYGLTVTVDAPAGAFPANTKMQVIPVVSQNLIDAITGAVEGEVKSVTAVDITFFAPGGIEVEPLREINVSLRHAVVETADKVDVVHLDANKNAEVVEQSDAATEADEVTFTADQFSIYAIVETTVITIDYLTADGETYNITVRFDEDAEIPVGAELVVREILRGTEEYDYYRSQTMAALGLSDMPIVALPEEEVATLFDNDENLIAYDVAGLAQPELSFVRFFDISIMDGEEKIEPKAPVEVTITYVESLNTGDGSSLDVIHFAEDGIELVENVSVSSDGTEIVYEAESFSVYGTARSSVGAGDFIIYRDGNSDYALNYTNGTLGRQAVSVGNDRVTSENDNVVWTFTAVTGGYQLSYQVGGTTYYLRDNNGALATTTNSSQASTWTYSNNRLSTRTGNTTRYLQYNNSAFSLSTSTNNATIYLAKLAEPATITIHYVNESGADIIPAQRLADSTSSGQTAITDIVQSLSGYTYHDTFLTSISGTQIVPELRGAGGGAWEYQVYGQNEYTQFSGNTDIYVVYGNPYGSSSGGGGGDDEPSIDVPETGKAVTPNTDGTFTLSLSITGEGDTGSESHGANVILVMDTSSSMTRNSVTFQGRTMTRLAAAKLAAQQVSTNLLGMNTEENPELVEMCIVRFDGMTATSTSDWYTVAGNTTTPNTFNYVIQNISDNQGTNWEDGLAKAIAAANGHQDGDSTYIIFLTDGNPSFTGTPTDYTFRAEATSTTGGAFYREHEAYMQATDEARQIVKNGWNFYTIGMFGNVDVLQYLTNFAYTGRSNGNEARPNGKYFPAAQTQTLINALDDIAEVISNSLALAGVDFNDGIAQDVTHTALTANVGTGSLGGVTYTKAGGTSSSYTVTVDTAGAATFRFGSNTVAGNITTIQYNKIIDGTPPTTETASAQVYAATYNGTPYFMPIATVSGEGDFEWDLSPLGTLEKNATYTVSFKVWPDQDAYDYVTNLNNGIPGYTWDDSTAKPVYQPNGTTVAYYRNGVSQYPNIVKYPNGTFAAMSNTYQSVDYYIADTEESGGTTTTTYEKGQPIALDVPDPMVLTGSSFQVTKTWSDSLDPGQLAKLIAEAEAQGKVYGVTLNLKEDGAFYKAYTFTPVKNESTGEYEWPSQTINIAPALLTSTYPGGGTYRTVTIDGTSYYVLNDGHEYVLEETNTDQHFEFNTIVYHPALVNGVLKNVSFQIGSDGKIVDGSSATVVGDVPLVTFEGENTLRGGINVYKKVVEEDGTVVEDNTDVFDAEITLTVPMKDGVPDFSHVENYYDDDDVTILIPSVAWYRYYDVNGNVVYDDALIDAGILEDSGQTSQYGRIGQGENYDGSGWFYLDFNDTTGTVTGTIKIVTAYTLRFTNMAAGTAYELTETGTQGMQPSYEFWHDNASSDAHIVIGNAGNNIRVTNKIVNRKIIVYKTDMDESLALSGASFTILDYNLTTDDTGYTAVIELPINTTPYDLTETAAPAGYNMLTGPVKITVASDGVRFQQMDYHGGETQTAEKDADRNYVVIVRDSPGTALPNTGGSGTLLNTIGGITLMMIAAVMYGFRMRRRERRYN